ncbi:MAG: GxxExxY protein [Chloroflexi bacterium]|nr:GxxExxY protein [Chloroflexota bacterium]
MAKIITPHDALTYKVIGLAMAVHNELGPGFPEEFYQKAMEMLMKAEKVQHDREFPIEIFFRGQIVGKFELDFVVERTVVLEFKAVATLAPIHEQQVLSYLAASGLPVGLLINFGAARLQQKRLFPSLAVQASPAFIARQTKSK